MNLNRRAREFYDLTITTEPAVSGWEASFDKGATWVAGEDVPIGDPGPGETRTRWLVAGPSADPTDATPLTSSGQPLLRATDNPEVVVRKGPAIYLV